MARTRAALRVLETSHPPTYYLPMSCFTVGALRAAEGGSFCEWKGQASYLDVLGGDAGRGAVRLVLPGARPGLRRDRGPRRPLPGAVDRCTVDGELVTPQPGGFYGGWVTSAVVGPFKGDPGTMLW